MLDSSPVKQFTLWFDEALAAGLPEPNAMVLTTFAVADGPHARTVLLKEHDDEGFTFYTNYGSRKGHDLAANPRAALCFYWPSLAAQVRAEGPVTKVSEEESTAYFKTRARVSQIGIVTGGAGAEVAKAAAEGVDTFITGEGPHWTYALAEDLGLNVLYGGHYATEVFGVKALAAHLSKRFRVPWDFIDRPTGL